MTNMWRKCMKSTDLRCMLPEWPEKRTVAHTDWIFPCNIKKYDVVLAYKKYTEIDWRQSIKCAVGDYVYIYCGKPIQRIICKTEVVKINQILEASNTIGNEFWGLNSDVQRPPRFGYARLKLLSEQNDKKLRLESLCQHGLTGVPQGALKVSAELLQYIEDCF